MRIEATVWHAQLYMWGQRLWQTFASSHERIELSSRTNICQYVRVLFLAFLAFLTYVAVMGYVGATLVYYPSVYFGSEYWWIIGKGVGIIILVVVLIALLMVTSEKIGKYAKQAKMKSAAKHVELVEVMEGTKDRPSIFTVAKQYVDAQSAGFCSAIEIVAPVAKTHFDRSHSVGAFNRQAP